MYLIILVEYNFLCVSDKIIANYEMQEHADPEADGGTEDELVETMHTHQEPSIRNGNDPENAECVTQ